MNQEQYFIRIFQKPVTSSGQELQWLGKLHDIFPVRNLEDMFGSSVRGSYSVKYSPDRFMLKEGVITYVEFGIVIHFQGNNITPIELIKENIYQEIIGKLLI